MQGASPFYEIGRKDCSQEGGRMLGSLTYYSNYRPPRLPVDREYLGSGEEYSHKINYSR